MTLWTSIPTCITYIPIHFWSCMPAMLILLLTWLLFFVHAKIDVNKFITFFHSEQ